LPAPETDPEALRVTLVAPPFAGHLNPLLAIGKRLAARGHELRYVTGPRKAALIERCGFAVDPVSNADPGAMERIADTPHPVRGHPLRLARQLRANLALLPEIRREIEASFARSRPDLVIADFCAPWPDWSATAWGSPGSPPSPRPSPWRRAAARRPTWAAGVSRGTSATGCGTPSAGR